MVLLHFPSSHAIVARTVAIRLSPCSLVSGYRRLVRTASIFRVEAYRLRKGPASRFKREVTNASPETSISDWKPTRCHNPEDILISCCVETPLIPHKIELLSLYNVYWIGVRDSTAGGPRNLLLTRTCLDMPWGQPPRPPCSEYG
jgi:hypothetical protein